MRNYDAWSDLDTSFSSFPRFLVFYMTSYDVPTLSARLNTIRSLPASEIDLLSAIVVPNSKLPLEYLTKLKGDDLTTALRACLLSWAVTNGTQVPREFQLRACLATQNGQDSLINAGTGSGKTLPIALNLLLDDPIDTGISLTISPLKRLQITQVSTTINSSLNRYYILAGK